QNVKPHPVRLISAKRTLSYGSHGLHCTNGNASRAASHFILNDLNLERPAGFSAAATILWVSKFSWAEFFRNAQRFCPAMPKFFPCYAVIFSLFCSREIWRNLLRQHTESLVPWQARKKQHQNFLN